MFLHISPIYSTILVKFTTLQTGSHKKQNVHIVWLIEEAYFFTLTNTPRIILCYWTWCRPKDHENSEWNANELCGPSENRSFLALSTPLEIIHHFSLDAVQKTTRAEKYVNELSGSLRNDTLEQDQHHYSTRDTFFRLDAVQKTMKTEKNVNELSGPPEKRSF